MIICLFVLMSGQPLISRDPDNVRALSFSPFLGSAFLCVLIPLSSRFSVCGGKGHQVCIHILLRVLGPGVEARWFSPRARIVMVWKGSAWLCGSHPPANCP